MAAWYDVLDLGDVATASPLAVSGAAAAVGTADKWAREDHRHAFAPTTDLSMAGFKITSVGAPTSGNDAVNKTYADGIAGGVIWKSPVRAATAAALAAYTRTVNNITASGNGALTVDGVTMADGDRMLLKDGAAGEDNGIYLVTDKGSAGTPFILDRSTDADTSGEVVSGVCTFVEEGTANSDKGFVLITNNPITLNTTALSFVQFTGLGAVTAGDGLTKTGDTVQVVAADGTIVVNPDSIQVGVLAAGNFANGTIANGRLITDPLARANHTGSQTASTISDFDTQVRTSRLDQMAAPQGETDYSHASAFLKLPKVKAYANAAALPTAAANGMLAFQTDTLRLRISR